LFTGDTTLPAFLPSVDVILALTFTVFAETVFGFSFCFVPLMVGELDILFTIEPVR
jgi:hypothetical protein